MPGVKIRRNLDCIAIDAAGMFAGTLSPGLSPASGREEKNSGYLCFSMLLQAGERSKTMDYWLCEGLGGRIRRRHCWAGRSTSQCSSAASAMLATR